jgi:hypothetical protein
MSDPGHLDTLMAIKVYNKNDILSGIFHKQTTSLSMSINGALKSSTLINAMLHIMKLHNLLQTGAKSAGISICFRTFP